LALDAAFFHQTTDPEAPAQGRFIVGHLGGTEEEYQITLEGIQNQYGSNTQGGNTRSDDSQFFMTRFHFSSLVWLTGESD
jgi:hypothetical protein